jgi:hypothetical protein
LFATAAVSRATRRATTATKIITLSMSGIANAYAMAHTAEGMVMQGPAWRQALRSRRWSR